MTAFMSVRLRPCLVATLGLAAVALPARAQQPLYVANCGPDTVTKITRGVQTTFASSGLNAPNGLAFDASGNLYVANRDLFENIIERLTPGGVASQFASTGLDGSDGLAFDGAGNLYGTNFGNNTIERFTPGGIRSIFASKGLSKPQGLAFDRAGNLYVANSGNNTIERFTPSGVGTVFASDGLSYPIGLAFDAAGNLYAANAGDNTIERFTPSGVGTVFASGLASPRFLAFGPAVRARARGIHRRQPGPDAGPGRGRLVLPEVFRAAPKRQETGTPHAILPPPHQ